MGEARRKRLEPKGRNGLSDYSKWHGVKVNSKFRQVSSLALPYHRIKGKLNRAIDEFFVKLRGLAELHLVGNRLSGYISPNINHVRSLRLVLLRNNCLTGKIPESMGELRALVALDVSRNQLTGTIPSTFEVRHQTSGIYFPFTSHICTELGASASIECGGQPAARAHSVY